jgi:SAM-dependent methyltransferase
MKEADIRPAALFDRYLALCREDAERFFRADEWEDVACPACGAAGEPQFVKHAFRYCLCPVCDTIFASPRPTASALGRLYTESASVRFWASDFYRDTERARRELMFKPRAMRVRDAAAAAGVPTPAGVVDIGAGYGVFCEEIQKVWPDAVVCGVEPSPTLAVVCRGKGFRVIEKFVEDVTRAEIAPPDGPAVFTSFELFEHLHDPRRFLERCRALLRTGDLLVLTTLSGTGLDIQVLWENAKAVFPPHHLNFFNPWSLERLAAACGFGEVTITTPGRLDVDIVRNSLSAGGEGRFFRTVFKHGSEEARAELQAWLQKHRFSSHMMMVAHP